ncbi:hypothetical protein LSTR_LSTR004074 [Laodelphax striatellus]|uniref:Fucosyltransferase n=1 Tax=Laodelphax striatellus TaxID=195883 RepID=A0A482WHE3_LAOST|nr:hypothetical protein LSTR_LSTR004074 [Laodelphax striatellus]
MNEATEKKAQPRCQRCLLFIICCACVIFIFAVHIDRFPNTATVFYHLRNFNFSSNSTTALKKKVEERPWYLTNGTRWPNDTNLDTITGRRDAKLWPNEDKEGDRILDQLMFVPPDNGKPLPMKTIRFVPGLVIWEVNHPKGSPEPFVTCPVNRCKATTNSLDADALLFVDIFYDPRHHKPAKQVWILYRMESPIHTPVQNLIKQDIYNWTATYLRSSDIVRTYFKWTYYDEQQTEWQGPPRNFSAGKTRKVAWFVSNCNALNNRLEYARELAEHIQIDMFGGCGAQYQCPKSKKCFKLLETTYKFYLAFENSNCREYITEKFWENGLQHNVIPIVMGAPREDYELVSPKHSFIHVEDFDSPKDLAAYLHKVDQDDDLYNSYFKNITMREVIEGYFYCRLCAMLHDDYPNKYYERIDDFWQKPGSCIRGSMTWREYRKTQAKANSTKVKVP